MEFYYTFFSKVLRSIRSLLDENPMGISALSSARNPVLVPAQSVSGVSGSSVQPMTSLSARIGTARGRMGRPRVAAPESPLPPRSLTNTDPRKPAAGALTTAKARPHTAQKGTGKLTGIVHQR